jgi:hypothetical protein
MNQNSVTEEFMSPQRISSDIQYIYMRILQNYHYMIEKSDNSMRRIYSPRYERPFIIKSVWLVCNTDFRMNNSKLKETIQLIDGKLLNENDYALMFFLSCQANEATQESLKTLPLSLLHDMYDPIAEANYSEWQKTLP